MGRPLKGKAAAAGLSAVAAVCMTVGPLASGAWAGGHVPPPAVNQWHGPDRWDWNRNRPVQNWDRQNWDRQNWNRRNWWRQDQSRRGGWYPDRWHPQPGPGWYGPRDRDQRPIVIVR